MHAYAKENIMGIIHATYCIHVQYINGNHFRFIDMHYLFNFTPCANIWYIFICNVVLWHYPHTFLAFRQMILYIGVKPKDTAFF